jgi:hypothetical protein
VATVDSNLTICVRDRILCDEGETWAEIRAVLVNLATNTFDRAVIEPAHRVAVGQFAPAESISADDGTLVYDGYLAFFDMGTRAEVAQWSAPNSRTVPVLSGEVIAVDGLTTLKGDTPAIDKSGQPVGNVIGVTVSPTYSLEALVIRSTGLLRHRDVVVSMDEEVSELGATAKLRVAKHKLRPRRR